MGSYVGDSTSAVEVGEVALGATGFGGAMTGGDGGVADACLETSVRGEEAATVVQDDGDGDSDGRGAFVLGAGSRGCGRRERRTRMDRITCCNNPILSVTAEMFLSKLPKQFFQALPIRRQSIFFFRDLLIHRQSNFFVPRRRKQHERSPVLGCGAMGMHYASSSIYDKA